MVKVGIVGAGGMGNVHARQYRKISDVELSFFEPDAERAKTFTDRWSCPVASSLEDLFARVDIVDICLPTDMHVEIGTKAMKSGKAVLMEKPVAGSVADAMTLVNEAEKCGVPYMPGQVVRCFPDYRKGHELVEQGATGTPAHARVRRGGLAPMGSGGWFRDHKRSGGVLLDLAIHDFDWLRWTLGEVSSLYSASLGTRSGDTGPDYALTVLSFDSGAVAHVESTWMDPGGFRTSFEVSGSKGRIAYDSKKDGSLRTFNGTVSAFESPMDPLDDPYYRQISGFLNAVASGSPPAVSGYDGAMAVSIALAAIESARTGKMVKPVRP